MPEKWYGPVVGPEGQQEIVEMVDGEPFVRRLVAQDAAIELKRVWVDGYHYMSLRMITQVKERVVIPPGEVSITTFLNPGVDVTAQWFRSVADLLDATRPEQ